MATLIAVFKFDELKSWSDLSALRWWHEFCELILNGYFKWRTWRWKLFFNCRIEFDLSGTSKNCLSGFWMSQYFELGNALILPAWN